VKRRIVYRGALPLVDGVAGQTRERQAAYCPRHFVGRFPRSNLSTSLLSVAGLCFFFGAYFIKKTYKYTSPNAAAHPPPRRKIKNIKLKKKKKREKIAPPTPP